jgi:hypothetical protein
MPRVKKSAQARVCDLGPGLGPVAQIRFGSVPGSSVVHMIAIKFRIKHLGRPRLILLRQRTTYSYLNSSYARDTVGLRRQIPPDVSFSGSFVAAPSQK